MRWMSVLFLLLAGVAFAAPPAQDDDLATLILNTRADLELLANQAIAEGQRPEGWTFNVNNVNSPTFIADLWYDSELLAEDIFGPQRPQDWNGAPTTANAFIAARNIRHDLEVAADAEFGLNTRPEGWRGASPLYRCERALQNLVLTLTDAFNVNFQTSNTTPNYCLALASEAEGQVLRLLYTPAEGEQATFDQQVVERTLAVRGDLERLADEKLGLNTRPDGWIGNTLRESPTLASDVFLDLELLADTLLAPGTRPEGWIGVIPNVAFLAFRNLRHDLELLANAVAAAPRPRGWQGVNAIETCDPELQSLAALLTQAYGFGYETIQVSGGFCLEVAGQANQLAENPPVADVVEEVSEDERVSGESQYAFVYLDAAATQYMGAMPAGTQFRAWYRNFNESSMMFVSGDNFAVYIDRRWTTMSPDAFDRLPTTEGVKPLTFCDAAWCNGPGPTPTPTGSGAIEALLNAGTPEATREIGEVQENKTQVSWNNIRVTYLLDNAAARTAQVTLEICTDTTQTTCEPVLNIFDNALAAPKPVLSQSNGLNVYEFPYGYTANLLIEGSTLFSPDVWISDPTIR